MYGLQWMNEHASYKNIPHTLSSKGLWKGWCWLCVRRWVGDGDRLLHVDPKFFSRLWQHFSLILVAEGPSPLSGAGSHFAGILSPTATGTELNCNCHSNSLPWTDSLKLSVAPGYIIVWHPPASFGRTHLHRNSTTSTGQCDIPISSTGCFAALPLIYTGASLDWRLGQYVTTVQQRYGDTFTF